MWNNQEQMLAHHQRTRFPLVGVHASLDCQQCHANGQYVNLPVNCDGCHSATYQQTNNPAHAAAGFSTHCEDCHNIRTAKWAGVPFTHPASFPLAGGHAISDCATCHANGYTNTSSECYSCHAADYAQASNPDHAGGQFSHDCAGCHTINGWHPASFDHNLSGFPLTGAHASVNCAQCHVNGQYAGTPSACFDCHEANYNGTTNPNHVTGNFDHNCATCHTTSGWSPATFDHSQSAFPLTGAHVAVSCTQCHIGGQYAGTPTDCYSCHQQDYEGATAPDHVAGQFSHDCAECHTTAAWQPSTFDHNQTTFPLTGAHLTTSCQACHVNGQYPGTPTDCWACHQTDFEGVQDPDHVTGNFSHACAQCHTTIAWSPASFDHNGTNFPLTGAHVNASCTQCHINGQFQGTTTQCYGCHQPDYEGATDPNHVSNQFNHDCAQCHSTTSWSPSTFDHGQTQFPLTGAHTNVSCIACHVNGQYQGTPTECYACHQSDYDGATDPNHVSNQFSHDCTQCHTTAAWSPSSFDHGQTQFPLTGAHTSVSCIACHVNGQYQGTPTDCWSCHQNDYNGVTDPNHVQGQYDHNCTICHTTTGWSPATFDHNQTNFPLTGAHVSVACAQCHVNGQYQGTPTECVFCHQADYDNASNPNHQAAGFPTTCQDCHNTSGWTPAQFNHDAQWFPIYSGHHQGEWNTCADCHPNPNNFAIFTCIDCHAHNQNDMNDAHNDVPGYVWESNACYNCHPTGGGGGITQPRHSREMK
jgi:hypothetical protein